MTNGSQNKYNVPCSPTDTSSMNCSLSPFEGIPPNNLVEIEHFFIRMTIIHYNLSLHWLSRIGWDVSYLWAHMGPGMEIKSSLLSWLGKDHFPNNTKLRGEKNRPLKMKKNRNRESRKKQWERRHINRSLYQREVGNGDEWRRKSWELVQAGPLDRTMGCYTQLFFLPTTSQCSCQSYSPKSWELFRLCHYGCSFFFQTNRFSLRNSVAIKSLTVSITQVKLCWLHCKYNSLVVRALHELLPEYPHPSILFYLFFSSNPQVDSAKKLWPMALSRPPCDHPPPLTSSRCPATLSLPPPLPSSCSRCSRCTTTLPPYCVSPNQATLPCYPTLTNCYSHPLPLPSSCCPAPPSLLPPLPSSRCPASLPPYRVSPNEPPYTTRLPSLTSDTHRRYPPPAAPLPSLLTATVMVKVESVDC
ncbi:hypothetical protein VP01_725g1 [Puccinia sorghi]|uniref:Uncharacterized protein n=1 Tax=Puccinia sorghi TaxID=27349 RepID=A0A0L6UD46_9BASI|nr:hypothetical protein VP01_725g1 [Puccinia sorghi]